MKGKKFLTVLLATMLVFSSTVSVFASETKSNSKERKEVSSKNYIKGEDTDNNEGNDNNQGNYNNQGSDKYSNMFKGMNIGKAVAAAKVRIEVKENVPSKDYNLGKDANIGSAIRDAQEKAKETAKEPVKETPVEISQVLKDEIKAEYTAMRATEVANKAIFVAAVSKKNQVVSYIHKVAEGKIAYTDAQLTQLDTLSATFAADIKAVTDATISIKTAEAAVKENAKSKNFDAVLAGLKTEAAARIARGTALTKVSQDLDAFLLVLVEGQAVLPTPVAPATTATPEATTTPATTATPAVVPVQ